MKRENPRARRLGEQIQRELTEVLRRDVKDGRIGNVTITAVDVTGDLRTAKVHYLIFGKDGPDPKVQRGLDSAAGYLRNALSRALMIRHTPTLSFELDTSIAHGVRLTQLIDAVSRPGGEGHANGDGLDHGTGGEGDPHDVGLDPLSREAGSQDGLADHEPRGEAHAPADGLDHED